MRNASQHRHKKYIKFETRNVKFVINSVPAQLKQMFPFESRGNERKLLTTYDALTLLSITSHFKRKLIVLDITVKKNRKN